MSRDHAGDDGGARRPPPPEDAEEEQRRGVHSSDPIVLLDDDDDDDDEQVIAGAGATTSSSSAESTSRARPIHIEDSDDDEECNRGVVGSSSFRKKRPRFSEIGESDSGNQRRGGDFLATPQPPPFRLFATANDLDDDGNGGGGVGSSSSSSLGWRRPQTNRPPHCWTLREMLGFDDPPSVDEGDGGDVVNVDEPSSSSSSATTNINAATGGAPQWIVVFNYLIDFDWLINEVPELVSLRRSLVFYGTAMNSTGTDPWQSSAASADFVRLVPSDPPRSRCNPLPFKMPYGVHHTKMFLVGYESHLRVIIHTTNLLHSCVYLNTNGAYVQDFPLKSIFTTAKAKKNDGGPTNAPTAPSPAPSSSAWQSQRTAQHCHSEDAFGLSSSFEEDLVTYLESYRHDTKYAWPLSTDAMAAAEDRTAGRPSNPYVRNGDKDVPLTLVDVVRRCDFSSAQAVLIPSVPGWHPVSNGCKCDFGHLKLRRAVRNHAASRGSGRSDGGGPIICQFSSMGSLTVKWLEEFAASADVGVVAGPGASAVRAFGPTSDLARKIKLIWPTVEEVRTALGGYRIGDSIPGRLNNVTKEFVQPLYHRWRSRADPLRKRRAAPHIKTFLQLTADDGDGDGESLSVEWMVLTSHNLSRAAWGEMQRGKRGPQLFMRHWELGVFFAPTLFSDGIGSSSEGDAPREDSSEKGSRRAGGCTGGRVRMVPFAGSCKCRQEGDVVLPLPFDAIPVPYTTDDLPWAVDRPNSIPDAYGRLGCSDP